MSMSKSCHLIFHASKSTLSCTSRNDLLEKEKRKLNKVVEIVKRWYSHEIEFHTYITKM